MLFANTRSHSHITIRPGKARFGWEEAVVDPYEELTCRNQGFLPSPQQAGVRHTRLLVAGCGLGSVVAEVALRTGFEHMLLADGDEVATHNLNRQVYRQWDVGRKKTVCLEQRLRDIYPKADIETCPAMLTAHMMPEIVAQADLIIDTIDLLDAQAVLALHREARRQGKTVLAPFTLGWGGAVLVFRPDGTSIEDLTAWQGRLPETHEELLLALVQSFQDRIPSYVIAAFERVLGSLKEGTACSGPQLGVATYLTAALTVASAVRVALGLTVREAPEPIYFDPVVLGL